MEASIEIETGRLEGWRREIASMRRKVVRQSVAITAGISITALYVVLSHGRGELVLMLAALAFLVLVQMLGQIRMLRFLQRDIFSHLLMSPADSPAPGQLPTAPARHGQHT